jgi:hypothetical protein
MDFREFDKSAQQEGCYVSDWAELVPLSDSVELPEGDQKPSKFK